MPDSRRGVAEPWPEEYTPHDVAKFAYGRVVVFCAMYEAGFNAGSEQTIIESIKGIRNIATRLDHFRRTRAKQRTAAAPANSQQETTEK